MAVETVSFASKRRKLLWATDSKAEREVAVGSTPPQHGVADLPPPFAYERLYSSYGQEWSERRKSIPLHMEILDLTTCRTGRFSALVACTSLGEVLLWIVGEPTTGGRPVGTETAVSEQESTASCLMSVPSHRWKLSELPLKSIQALSLTDSSDISSPARLVAGGTEGLWSMDLNINQDGSFSNKPQKWNASPMDVKQVLLGGSSDSVYVLEETGRVHLWNREAQMIRRTLELRGSFATTMALTTSLRGDEQDIKEGRSSSSSNMLLIGTSESQLLVWTESSGELETIPLGAPTDTNQTYNTGNAPSRQLPFEISVRAICCSHDQWWTIAGVRKKSQVPSFNIDPPNSHGILFTLHSLTRTVVAIQETREAISKIVAPFTSELYTVANEGIVTVWDSPYQLERRCRVWTSSPSGKAATSLLLAGGPSQDKYQKSMVVALAGVGPTVDLIQDHCRIQTLDCSRNA